MAEPAVSNQSGGSCHVASSPVVFAPHARSESDGLQHLTLAVDNVSCANCIKKIERTLAADPVVKAARVNLSTKRLTLAWQGEAAYADVLARQVQELGYPVVPFAQSKPDESDKFLLMCMAVAGFSAGNIMLLSFALWMTDNASMGEGMRAFMHWMSALIAIPTVLFSGRPFFRSALAVLRKGHTNMDVPISVGIILTTGISIHETLIRGEHAYFDSVVMLIFFLLVGRYLDHRARQRARVAASELMQMMAGSATIIEADGTYRVLAIRDLAPGMTLQVAMGERIAADGLVTRGKGHVDCSLITGETIPQTVSSGTQVFSGMLNMDAPLEVQVSRPADNSLLGEIVRLMEKAEQSQSAYVRLADRAARLYTPVVHLLALLTFLGWITVGALAWQPALLIAATVLIITCPCALGLAVPVVQVVASGELMKRGVMLKSGDALERLAAIDTLLLDKTGTLTLGQPDLTGGTYTPADLQLAASMASQSRHPLSQAVVRAARQAGLALDPLEVSEHPGEGLASSSNGRSLRLGRRSWCHVTAESQDEQTELWLAKEGAAPVRFVFADQLRVDAKEVVAELQKAGLSLELLSGDRSGVTAAIAGQLGIAKAVGELKPADKYSRVEELRKQGHKIGMVGDGLNDAPTLAYADISLSPASALDMVQNTADLVFMGTRLLSVLTALQMARRAKVAVMQNFVMSVLYNIIAIPVAMAGYVTPAVAALAMSGSSIIVIVNALRLKRGN